MQIISDNDSLYVDLHLGGSVSRYSEEYVDCDFFLDLFGGTGYCLSVLEYWLEQDKIGLLKGRRAAATQI